MRGFSALLGKDLLEIVRTWRAFVLPGIVLFAALTGPPSARYTPEILAAVTAGQPGLVIEVPDPTYLDSYAQWVKNLSQIVTFALVIIWGGLVSAERRSGTAALAVTKPVSRAAFVCAKALSAALLLVATVTVGAAVTWGLTLAMFGHAPAAVLASVTATWLAQSLLLLAVMTLLSTLVRSAAGAAGLGFGVVVVASLLTIWPAAVAATPVGLVAAPGAILAGAEPSLGLPVATGTLAAAACVGAAVWVFGRQEI